MSQGELRRFLFRDSVSSFSVPVGTVAYITYFLNRMLLLRVRMCLLTRQENEKAPGLPSEEGVPGA